MEHPELVLAYNQNALKDSLFNKLSPGLLYNHQPLYCPSSVQRLGLDCMVEHTDTNQGIIPISHNICVESMESDLDDTFPGCFSWFAVLYFSWTVPNQIL
jgi:hypothetical protein